MVPGTGKQKWKEKQLNLRINIPWIRQTTGLWPYIEVRRHVHSKNFVEGQEGSGQAKGGDNIK